MPLSTDCSPVVPGPPETAWDATCEPPADVPILRVVEPAVPTQTFLSSILPFGVAVPVAVAVGEGVGEGVAEAVGEGVGVWQCGFPVD